MTTGSFSKDYRISLPGHTGLYGLQVSRSWNGTDRPKIKKLATVKEYAPRTVERLVWRGKRQVVYSHTYQYRVYSPSVPPKRGKIEMTDHPFTKTWTARNSGALQLSDGRMFTTDGAGYFLRAVPAELDSFDELSLIGRLRTKVAGSDFNAGVFLAELSPALRMIGESAYRINEARKFASRFDLIQASHALTRGTRWFRGDHPRLRASKDFSENWLQLQYGWLPLLADVENAAQFAAHHLNVGFQQVVRVSLRKQFGTLQNSSPSNILLPLNGQADFEISYLNRKSIKATLKEVNVPQLSGLTDPWSVAWEILPYSFVVDWFVPVGQWLSARGLKQALSGSFVISQKKVGYVRGMRLNPANHLQSSKDYWDSAGSFTRTISSSLPIPQPSVKGVGEALTWKRATSAVALLVQQAASLGRRST